MKKFLSILLAAAMLVAVFGVNVLAATEPHPVSPNTHDGSAKEYWVIGEQGKNSDIDNGRTEAEFNAPVGVTSNINVNFNVNTSGTPGVGDGNAVEERYAVDINYWDLVVDLTNLETTIDSGSNAGTYKYVWDVNTHTYVLLNTADENADTSGAAVELGNAPLYIDAFQIVNHSSKSVWYNAKVTNSVESIMTLKIITKNPGPPVTYDTFVFVNPTDVASSIELARATNAASQSSVYAFEATPTTGTWADVMNSLVTGGYATGNSIGTLTIRVAKTGDTAKFNP